MDMYNTPDKAAYLAENGWHFNKRACEDAVRMMKRKGQSGKAEPLDPWNKEQVDELLQKYGIKLENKIGHDYVYVANMAKADFYKSSLPDEQKVAQYIKDVVDDIDAADGEIFIGWYAKTIARRMPVDWGAWL